MKCDTCGKFISYIDLDNGSATVELVTPDSDLSAEEFENTCAECNGIAVEVLE